MGARENDIFLNFTLDKLENALYNTQAFGGNAAIAQPVERILGKDEVASSNLASSSKPSEIFGFQRVSFVIEDNRQPKVQNRQFCKKSQTASLSATF